MICHLPGLWQQCTDRKRVLAKTTGKEKSHNWPNGIRHVPHVPRSGTSYGLVSPYRLYLFRRFAVCFHWSSNCEVHKLWSVVYLNHNKSNSSNSHAVWVCDFYGSQAYSNSLKVLWTSLKVNQSTCASTEKNVYNIERRHANNCQNINVTLFEITYIYKRVRRVVRAAYHAMQWHWSSAKPLDSYLHGLFDCHHIIQPFCVGTYHINSICKFDTRRRRQCVLDPSFLSSWFLQECLRFGFIKHTLYLHFHWSTGLSVGCIFSKNHIWKPMLITSLEFVWLRAFYCILNYIRSVLIRFNTNRLIGWILGSGVPFWQIPEFCWIGIKLIWFWKHFDLRWSTKIDFTALVYKVFSRLNEDLNLMQM